MAWKSQTLETSTGANLRLFSSQPKGTCKGVVQINHGMAEHAGRYERFAQALNKAGYAAYAHDHRGHGETKAPGTSLGVFAPKMGWDLVLGDVADLNAHIAQQHPNVPIVCFGHSMGCIIAFNYVLRHPETVSAAALWNAGVDTGALAAIYGGILKIQRMFKGSDVPSGIAKKLTFEAWNKQFAPNRTNFDWLSHDEAEVDKYVSDPLCGFDVSIGLWLDVLQGIYYAADNKNLAALPQNFPVHLQAGDQDPSTEKGASLEHIHNRMKTKGMSKVMFELLKDARHESLNETARDEVTDRFIGWLNQHI